VGARREEGNQKKKKRGGKGEVLIAPDDYPVAGKKRKSSPASFLVPVCVRGGARVGVAGRRGGENFQPFPRPERERKAVGVVSSFDVCVKKGGSENGEGEGKQGKGVNHFFLLTPEGEEGKKRSVFFLLCGKGEL